MHSLYGALNQLMGVRHTKVTYPIRIGCVDTVRVISYGSGLVKLRRDVEKILTNICEFSTIRDFEGS